MLVLFNYIYETKNGKDITVDQYTIERFFYTSHSMENIYKAIETEGEQLEEFYGKMYDKFSGSSNILIEMKEYTIADPNFTQAMVNDFKVGKDTFVKSPAQTVLTLFSIDKVDGNL